MSTYQYPITGSGIKILQLIDDIKKSISKQLYKQSSENNNYIFYFTQPLTTEEEATLDSIVANHVPIEVLPQGKFSEFYVNLHPYIEFNSSPTPQVLSYYYYAGSIAANGLPSNCYIVHNGQYSSGSSYEICVKVKDITNNTTIMDETITGFPDKNNFFSKPQVHETTSLSNVPIEKALFEFTYQLVSGTKGRIYIIHMY